MFFEHTYANTIQPPPLNINDDEDVDIMDMSFEQRFPSARSSPLVHFLRLLYYQVRLVVSNS
jgi:hypothetical protein